MSKVIQNKGGIGTGAPYDLPGYEYDPVTDKFKDLATGKSFDKDGGAKLEDNKAFTVDTNGTIVVNPSATYDGMKKVTLNVQVPEAELENNKAATIDVSAYTDPVEVTPTEGKDGMKKVTVTLDNIPSGGGNKLYAWGDGSLYSIKENLSLGDSIFNGGESGISTYEVTEVGADFIVAQSWGSDELQRNSQYDIIVGA